MKYVSGPTQINSQPTSQRSKVLAITGKCLASKINYEFVITVEENRKALLG